jgi:hypothetical protein
MSTKTQLENIKSVTPHVFAGLMNTMMAETVMSNWHIPEAFLEDAGFNMEDAVSAIVDLLRWKQMVEIKEMAHYAGDDLKTVGDVYEYLLELMRHAIEEGDYADLTSATKDCAMMALTYRCYEDWQLIVENAIREGKYDEETFVNVVNYLYDGYTEEVLEECLEDEQ